MENCSLICSGEEPQRLFTDTDLYGPRLGKRKTSSPSDDSYQTQYLGIFFRVSLSQPSNINGKIMKPSPGVSACRPYRPTSVNNPPSPAPGFIPDVTSRFGQTGRET